MRNFTFLFLSLFNSIVFSQQIYSVNSGAVSNTNLIYSVGEIFVNSTIDENESSSGLIGAISIIEFYVLGTDDLISSDDFRIFPNPTEQILFFKTQQKFSEVFIYDFNGILVLNEKLNGEKKINLSQLINGVYILKTDNPNIEPLKLIKK